MRTPSSEVICDRTLLRLGALALTLGSLALGGACASQAAAVPALPPDGTPPRRVPVNIAKLSEDFYPTEAKRQSLTGRVLLQFQIHPSGTPQDTRVLAAEADPTLQAAALALLKHLRFDTTDPAYNAADAAPYRTTILFCMFSCGSLTPYAGYEQAQITVTGYRYIGGRGTPPPAPR